MKISAIQIKDASGNVTRRRKAFIREGYGLGEHGKKDPEREISLAGSDAASWAQDHEGLCVRKFTADLVTDGLDYESLSAGDLLKAGSALIEIRSVGKRCFSECPVTDKPCPLGIHCAFGRVICGGEASEGDALERAGAVPEENR
ncbi:MAG: hypothetical protein J5822_06495 [Eubacteriaceae bacterium]|nr:hypothetical protein [Eubacteriaceae bacterium]